MTIGVSIAPTPTGPFQFSGQGVVEVGSEDPHLFRDPAGNFHAIFHHNNYKSWPLAQGTHAFSRDGMDWVYSSVFAYTGIIEQTDGTTVVWNRRERPHVVLNETTGHPMMLTTGVGNAVDGWTMGQDWTWTHMQRIRQP